MKAIFESTDCDERKGFEYEYMVDANRICLKCRPAEYPSEVHGDGIYRAIRDCNTEGWEEIISATIENGHYVDVMEKLPSGYHVFRSTRKSSRMGGVEISAREKAIRLDCSLEVPDSFLYLTQGIGQAVADDTDPALLAVTKSARRLFMATNVEVHRSILGAEQAGWEFMWEQLDPFLSDDPTAVYNRGRVLEGIYRNLEQRSTLLHGERSHPYKETLRRVGRSVVLLAANTFSDKREKPLTYEEFMKSS